MKVIEEYKKEEKVREGEKRWKVRKQGMFEEL